jgi:hypothetical protein
VQVMMVRVLVSMIPPVGWAAAGPVGARRGRLPVLFA